MFIIQIATRGFNISLPDEKTRAIKKAKDFLQRLLSPYGEKGIKKIPTAVRKEAYWVLRHFPGDYEIDHIAECRRCSKILGPEDKK